MSSKTARATIVRIGYPFSGLAAGALCFKSGGKPYYVTGYPYTGQQMFGPDDGIVVVEEMTAKKTVQLPYWFVVGAVVAVQSRKTEEKMRAFLLEHKDLFCSLPPVDM